MINDWIITHSGKRFELADPRPEMVCIEDIAIALARQTRFNGHCDRFYSVAMHSYIISNHLPKHLRLEGLLHDAAEAYIGDISSPLKKIIKAHWPGFKAFETRIEEVIFDALGVPLSNDPMIKEYDLRMLAVEHRDLMPKTEHEWSMLVGVKPLSDVFPERESLDAQLTSRSMYHPEVMAPTFIKTFNYLKAKGWHLPKI
ncbi:deoxyribonucleoside 5' monophosphate phosphatase [Pseudomonas phage vB_PpuM-Voja-6]